MVKTKVSAEEGERSVSVLPAIRSLVATCLMAELTLAASLSAQETPARTSGPRGFLLQTPIATLGVRGGFNVRLAGSDIFDFVTSELTLDRSDFSAFGMEGELAIRVAAPVDVVLGGGHSQSTAHSEFRDYVDQDGLPITQTTTLATTPLTVAVRYYLTPRGRQIGRFAWIPARLTPYVGVGAGFMHYSFEQSGSFVDHVDLSIFDDTLTSADWTPLGMAMAGLSYSLGSRVFLSGDLRYHLAKGELTGDFLEWTDGIDLSGFQFSTGIHFRI